MLLLDTTFPGGEDGRSWTPCSCLKETSHAGQLPARAEGQGDLGRSEKRPWGAYISPHGTLRALREQDLCPFPWILLSLDHPEDTQPLHSYLPCKQKWTVLAEELASGKWWAPGISADLSLSHRGSGIQGWGTGMGMQPWGFHAHNASPGFVPARASPVIWGQMVVTSPGDTSAQGTSDLTQPNFPAWIFTFKGCS